MRSRANWRFAIAHGLSMGLNTFQHAALKKKSDLFFLARSSTTFEWFKLRLSRKTYVFLLLRCLRIIIRNTMKSSIKIELSFACRATTCPSILIAAITATAVKLSYFFVIESCRPAFSQYLCTMDLLLNTASSMNTRFWLCCSISLIKHGKRSLRSLSIWLNFAAVSS